MTVEAIVFQELNNDQRRELINTRQRFDALRAARAKLVHFKGSMVWTSEGDHEYLIRSYYDPKTGIRRQKSLGRRNAETEKLKADFEAGRDAAKKRLTDIEQVVVRQASINRAIGLGRMPLIGAQILRALDAAGLLGTGLRAVGTNALYAYEAVAGITLDAAITTTEDIDLLFDARTKLRLAASLQVAQRNILHILRRVDRSFERDKNTFRAINRDGYLVDLIKPEPQPPWRSEAESFSPDGEEDLAAAGIDGLKWLQNSPTFEAVVVDERGAPVRIVAPDPRAFAIHKLWTSRRSDRAAVKRRRDLEQAKAVGQIVARYLTHLPFDHRELRAIPESLVADAAYLFQPAPVQEDDLV